jgi:hypothetical protein
MTALQLGGFRAVYATGEAGVDRDVAAEMDCPACAKRALPFASSAGDRAARAAG